jgi:hypothetical protein
MSNGRRLFRILTTDQPGPECGNLTMVVNDNGSEVTSTGILAEPRKANSRSKLRAGQNAGGNVKVK